MTGDTAVYHLKAYQLTYRTFRFLLLQHRTIDEVLTLYKFGNPPQSGFDRRGRIIQIISIQAESHFKTKRITSSQADRLDTKLSTCFKHSIPYLHGYFRIKIKFKTTRTGIAGIGNNDIRFSCKLTMRKSIVRKLGKIDRRQLLQRLNSFRPLHCELRHAVGCIFEFSSLRIMGHTPVPVLLYVGSIDNQQVFLGFILINKQVVHNASILVWKTGVLHLTGSKRRHIIRSHFLQKVQCMRTFHPKLSHVGDIEHTHTIHNGHVFVDNTGVFDRHVETCKFMHFGTECNVHIGKRSCFHDL